MVVMWIRKTYEKYDMLSVEHWDVQDVRKSSCLVTFTCIMNEYMN